MTRPDDTGAETLGETSSWLHSVPARDLTGATLGDFQVERLLGRGGMGEVYLATQISLNRPVALKVLRPDLLTKPTYLSRFEAEATAVAKLNHPNIVHIYMLGAVGEVRFIAMEYVQGSNLRDYLRKKGAVDYPLALSIMRQAGLAVGAAGEIGLVHRDIKPENLLLTRKGQVKVTDFGLCRDLDPARVNLTQTGITMGTPLYMSPEQAQGHDLDHRSDLYSLGVTFYHMLAGVPPFKADSPLALALKHVKDTPASIAVHRPDVPPELDRLVLKLMAKSPADRYQSAAEMLRDLARVREAMHAPSTVQPVADVPGSSAAVEAAPPVPAGTPSGTAAVSGSRAATLRTRFLSADAAPPWLGRRAGSALVALGLAAGAAAGWANRPGDLLSPAAAGAGTPAMPGLWMDPRWQAVERGLSPEDQYLYAQVRAPKEVQEAAWLAVPGHFPNSREWASRAYTQLARLLLVRHDVDRLRALAEEVDRWEGGQTHEKELAAIIRAGAKALDRDLEGVLADFKERVRYQDLTDPALIGLSVEVTDQAERAASGAGAATNNVLARNTLHGIRQQLVARLFQTGIRDPLFARLRAG
jgi:serine/threonine-protein kinase